MLGKAITSFKMHLFNKARGSQHLHLVLTQYCPALPGIAKYALSPVYHEFITSLSQL